MSRSFKKNPVLKDNNKRKKDAKNWANRRVRRHSIDEEALNGGSYKKIYPSENIVEYIARFTREDAIEYYNSDHGPNRKRFPTLQSWLNYWKKTMIRK